MNLEGILLSERSLTVKDIVLSHLYVKSSEQNKTKTQTHRNIEKVGSCYQGQIRAGMKILVVR